MATRKTATKSKKTTGKSPEKSPKEAYIEKLTEIYENIPPQNEKKAAELISRLAGVLYMMDECTRNLDVQGLVVSMPQGDYEIERENPYSKIYDAKHKLMLQTVDKLDKLLPDDASGKDELLEYLSQ